MIDLIKFILIGFVISIPIGPTTILAFQRILKYGLKAGLATGFGLVAADIIHSIITISRFPFIKDLIDNYASILKIVGFIVIIVIAFTTYRSKIEMNKSDKVVNKNLLSFFLGIFIYAIIHPASLILFLSLNASDLINDGNKLLLPFGILIGEVAWWTVINLIFLKFRDRISPKHFSVINKVTSVILVVLSALILLL